MKEESIRHWSSAKQYLLLVVLTLIVYWPLSLNLLSLKNDALVQYLAFRYHISEAIQNGHFPFWSPYLYTGFPIHEDIQGMVWNPIVLMLSLISKYNMTVLQWEVLIYLMAAAIGMYKLIKGLNFTSAVAISCAIAYMSCGKMTDSISILPYTGSAAFAPFVINYFLLLLKESKIANMIKLGMSLSFMFLCGYPSLFIFLNYLLLFGFIAWLLVQMMEQEKVTKPIVFVALAYLLFLFICSPAIVSFYEFLPYYSRGSGITYEKSITNTLPLFSLISWVIPNAVSKAHFLQTDLIMRNAYIGLYILIFFLISLLNLTNLKKLLVALSAFSLLFSLGNQTPIHKFCFNLLPLVNTFRHPADMRLFTSIGMIILAASPMNHFFTNGFSKLFQRLLVTFGVVLLTLIVYLWYSTNFSNLQLSDSLAPSSIKKLIYAFSFEQFTLFIAFIQFLFVVAFILFYRKQNRKINFSKWLIYLNSIVFAWIALPLTVVSQYSTKDVNAFIASFPDAYPLISTNTSVESNIISDSIQISVHGYHNFYNKKITIQDHIVTPTLNSDYVHFLNNKTLRKELIDFPFVYITDSNNQRTPSGVRLLRIVPNSFVFKASSQQPCRLHLFQQYHHNWTATLNGKRVPVAKDNIAFMSISVPAGESHIEWHYKPVKVYYAMIISMICLLALLGYSTFYYQRKQHV